ncbi:MAG: iron-containing alcohol dehydrogenase [Pseudothermotoga sp.]|uniref:iron-containing alcohol dehydrogenase family protein n=1 Tax=Pseudothermotoga sp. TaxID=2033661 RepID=UPI000A4925F4|nr:iron-containing alcohol dehydrogenase [Pseudothermotoga sp.]HBT40234.1 alcohol dehydrogenase [Pseudothermotoga sp.]HCO98633.1 alcohol dehydrogenase [Pseudothermotoga sp.]
MWQYFMPTKVYFGEKCIERGTEAFKSLGKRALILTGRRSSKENGSLDDVTRALSQIGIEWVLFDDVEENPTFALVRNILSEYQDGSFDFVIGLGGGSPMDTAKAIAVLLKNPALKVEDLYDASRYSEALPICAIPTTAGTGSEVTQYSVLTDDAGFKRGFSHPVLTFPKIAFLDARYTLNLSEALTRSTGLDALCHAVEGFLSRRATVLSDLYAKESIKLIAENLPRVLRNPNDLHARENMLLASCLAGMVISQTSTTIAHALGYPLTTFKGIRHGEATAAFLDVVVEQASIEVPDKVEFVRSVLGDVAKFLESVGLNVKVPINDEELMLWTSKAKNAPHLQWTRGNFTEELIRYLYERVKLH